MIELYSLIASMLLSLLCFFQLSLAMGAPLGRYAWGGDHERLPKTLRRASLLSIVIYAVFIIFILSKAGIIAFVSNQTVLSIGMWMITIYLFIGVAMNAMSRSKRERGVMTPTAGALAVLFLLVSLP